MGLVYTAFVPHPPLLIAEVGRGEERQCQATLTAYQELANRVARVQPETIILVSPHAPLAREGMTLVMDDPLQGDFAQFGAGQVRMELAADRTVRENFQQNIPGIIPIRGGIDHGAFVPLYFLQKAGWKGKIVLLGMPMERPEDYGVKMGKILDHLPGHYALIASGDLSHRLKEDGPYGFDPAGPEFDQFVVKCLQRDPKKITAVAADLIAKAGECGYRSLRLALAAKEGAPEILSYEGPFGVGYLAADLYHSSPLPQWARRCLSAYLKGDDLSLLKPPDSPEFTARQGCFVTLKEKGQLRGCIGTTEPWQVNLALEIQHNALAAGTRDPRFFPVQTEELKALTFTVDVLGELEKIEGPDELDPWRYGVVVRRQGKSGLLLPHLEGIDTVSGQIGIAKQKAGILPEEAVELWRFEVKRHYE